MLVEVDRGRPELFRLAIVLSYRSAHEEVSETDFLGAVVGCLAKRGDWETTLQENLRRGLNIRLNPSPF